MKTGLKSMNRSLLTAPALALMLNALPGQAASDPTLDGKTPNELSAAWWQYVLSIPVDQNPLLDPTGANANVGQSGPVFFLVGSPNGSPTTRQVTISETDALFFPLVNSVNISVPSSPETPDQLLAAISPFIDSVTGLNASIDGIAVPDLFSRRAIAAPFSVTLPENNLFGVDPGVYSPAVSDGYWLSVAPLSVGEHTITFGASNASGVLQDNTYNVTVQGIPEPTTVLGILTFGVMGAAAKFRRRASN